MGWAEPAGGRSIIVRCAFPGRECSTTIFPRPGWTQTKVLFKEKRRTQMMASPICSRKVATEEDGGRRRVCGEWWTGRKSSGEQKRKEGLNEEGDGAAEVKWQEGWESLNGRDLRRRPK